MLFSILVGTLLTIITIGLHGVGTSWWITRLRKMGSTIKPDANHHLVGFKILSSTATLLLLLHILEVCVWAVTYLTLPNMDAIETLEDAVYFSTVTYTSLGYGDIVITGPWRLLSGIQAVNGLFIFGWSTALLITIVQRIWDGQAT